MLAALSAVLLAAAAADASAWPNLDAMIKGSAKAITNRRGPFHGRELERFDTATGEVRAFQTDLVLGRFPTHYIFLVRPKDPNVGPMSLTVETDPMTEQMAGMAVGSGPATLDFFTCRTHATMAMMDRNAPYETVRAKVVEALDQGGGMTSTEVSGGRACPFITYVLPGLTRPR